MSRGFVVVRALGVWLLVSAATAAAVLAARGAVPAGAPGGGAADVGTAVVGLCAGALALSSVWVWLVTTATVAGALTGRVRTGGGAVRRVVLLACGAAVLAGATAPAVAAGGEGREVLVGLPLPERAVAPAATGPAAAVPRRVAPETYVVRPGDSLWSIAAAHPGPGGTDARWRAIWQDNHEVVGDDPDLIHPGQALRLPGPHDPQDGDPR